MHAFLCVVRTTCDDYVYDHNYYLTLPDLPIQALATGSTGQVGFVVLAHTNSTQLDKICFFGGYKPDLGCDIALK